MSPLAAAFPPPPIVPSRVLDQYNILDTDEEANFDGLARLASQMAQTPIALVSLLDGDRQWFKAHIGLEARETPIEYSFCTHAVQQNNVFVVGDAARDSRFTANPLVQGEPNIRFYAGAPLRMTDGLAVGTLCVIDRVPRAITDRECSMLQGLADIASREIELRRVAITDPLTGAFNRRSMMMMVQKELARFARSRSPFSLAAIDLDHFKRVNDIYGHEAGDAVLSRFVQLFRMGGEEFLLLQPDTDEAAAEKAIERFRRSIEETQIGTPAGNVRITASIGITEVRDEEASVSTLVGRADQALYSAKRQGRNRALCFREERPQ